MTAGKTPRRTKGQAEECQDRAYLLKVQGGLTFELIAQTPDPTGVLPQLYANASAARQAYLAAAVRHRGTESEAPLSVLERRAMQDDRYERLLQTWLPKAFAGSGEATDRCLRALNQQADLHGLKVKPAEAERAAGGEEDVADELAERRAKAQREHAAALRATAPAAAPPPARR